MTKNLQYTRSIIGFLAIMICACAATAAEATSHDRPQPDIRNLAALLLFNGEHGARAYDISGPIGDDDVVWSHEAAGRYTFETARPGVTVRGVKSVFVEGGCTVSIETRFRWLFATKPAETLERLEEFDFRSPVVADAALALQDDRPFATVLHMRSGDDFFCKATRINGSIVEPRSCASSVQALVGPGREDHPVLQHFRRFSNACMAFKSRG